MKPEQVPQFETMCKLVKTGHLLEVHEDYVRYGFRDVDGMVDDAVNCKMSGYVAEIDAAKPLEFKLKFI